MGQNEAGEFYGASPAEQKAQDVIGTTCAVRTNDGDFSWKREPAFTDPVKTDWQRPAAADRSPRPEDRFLGFDVRHKTGEAPDHYQHVSATGDGFLRECDDIFGLGREFDCEWQLRCRPDLANVLADDLVTRDLPDGGGFSAVRRTQVQLDPAQAGGFHLSSDVRSRCWVGDSDAAHDVRILRARVLIEFCEQLQPFVERGFNQPRAAEKRIVIRITLLP
jgi:hypothetical protein